jgi:hypothetical protein
MSSTGRLQDSADRGKHAAECALQPSSQPNVIVSIKFLMAAAEGTDDEMDSLNTNSSR